jgi:hypothetical protein
MPRGWTWLGRGESLKIGDIDKTLSHWLSRILSHDGARLCSQ